MESTVRFGTDYTRPIPVHDRAQSAYRRNHTRASDRRANLGQAVDELVATGEGPGDLLCGYLQWERTQHHQQRQQQLHVCRPTGASAIASQGAPSGFQLETWL